MCDDRGAYAESVQQLVNYGCIFMIQAIFRQKSLPAIGPVWRDCLGSSTLKQLVGCGGIPVCHGWGHHILNICGDDSCWSIREDAGSPNIGFVHSY